MPPARNTFSGDAGDFDKKRENNNNARVAGGTGRTRRMLGRLTSSTWLPGARLREMYVSATPSRMPLAARNTTEPSASAVNRWKFLPRAVGGKKGKAARFERLLSKGREDSAAFDLCELTASLELSSKTRISKRSDPYPPSTLKVSAPAPVTVFTASVPSPSASGPRRQNAIIAPPPPPAPGTNPRPIHYIHALMSMGAPLTADNGSLRLKRPEHEETNGIAEVLAQLQMKTSSAPAPTVDRSPTPVPTTTIERRTAHAQPLPSLQEQAGEVIAEVAASVLAPNSTPNAFTGKHSAWNAPASAFAQRPPTPTPTLTSTTTANAFEHYARRTHPSAPALVGNGDSLAAQAKALLARIEAQTYPKLVSASASAAMEHESSSHIANADGCNPFERYAQESPWAHASITAAAVADVQQQEQEHDVIPDAGNAFERYAQASPRAHASAAAVADVQQQQEQEHNTMPIANAGNAFERYAQANPWAHVQQSYPPPQPQSQSHYQPQYQPSQDQQHQAQTQEQEYTHTPMYYAGREAYDAGMEQEQIHFDSDFEQTTAFPPVLTLEHLAHLAHLAAQCTSPADFVQLARLTPEELLGYLVECAQQQQQDVYYAHPHVQPQQTYDYAPTSTSSSSPSLLFGPQGCPTPARPEEEVEVEVVSLETEAQTEWWAAVGGETETEMGPARRWYSVEGEVKVKVGRVRERGREKRGMRMERDDDAQVSELSSPPPCLHRTWIWIRTELIRTFFGFCRHWRWRPWGTWIGGCGGRGICGLGLSGILRMHEHLYLIPIPPTPPSTQTPTQTRIPTAKTAPPPFVPPLPLILVRTPPPPLPAHAYAPLPTPARIRTRTHTQRLKPAPRAHAAVSSTRCHGSLGASASGLELGLVVFLGFFLLLFVLIRLTLLV
ncbi:hypothetical protein B0H19DRAFT_1087806 [Mycena capillaripes]|nr:hypothetical protein B0H19DRAFT_1087806 [Mycena capillaripes]